MRKYIVLFIFVSLNFTQLFGQWAKEKDTVGFSIKPLWQSVDTLHTPESACLSEKHNCIFVSNLGNRTLPKDSDGFISKLSMKGEIVTRLWISGLHAPKGIAVLGNNLYTADLDQLVVIDINNNKVSGMYTAQGAVMLNDVAISPSGTVFVSDSKGNKIYIFDGENISLWLENKETQNINGLYATNDGLFIGSKSGIYLADYHSKAVISVAASNEKMIDGITVTSNRKFIVSDWKGCVQLMSSDTAPVTIFDTTADNVSAADVIYYENLKLLLVPTFKANRIDAYELIIK